MNEKEWRKEKKRKKVWEKRGKESVCEKVREKKEKRGERKRV